jgi:hypothetical protein
MKTAVELEQAFSVYFVEMDRCEKANCFWALLHLTVIMPDVCGALEFGSGTPVGKRYTDWCRASFPKTTKLTPDFRYQIRCALLHEGSTLTSGKKKQYSSVSFVDPVSMNTDVHLLVATDGTNIAIDIKALADETRSAIRAWFVAVEKDAVRNVSVEQNLPKLVRQQTKHSEVPIASSGGSKIVTASGSTLTVTIKYPTTSST